MQLKLRTAAPAHDPLDEDCYCVFYLYILCICHHSLLIQQMFIEQLLHDTVLGVEYIKQIRQNRCLHEFYSSVGEMDVGSPNQKGFYHLDTGKLPKRDLIQSDRVLSGTPLRGCGVH